MKSDQQIVDQLARSIRQLADPKQYSMVCHEHRVGEPLLSSEKVARVVKLVREILFPGYFGNTTLRPASVGHYIGVYVDELFELLSEQILAGLCFIGDVEKREKLNLQERKGYAQEITAKFIDVLPEIRRVMISDVDMAYVGDPAARGHSEVIYCYPAIRAIVNYRIAHQLLLLGVPLIPRIITEMAHSETGIDIHPNARIGESFTIDHGTGVVIGSTCIIGNQVKLYQGVTLGAKSFPLDENGNPIKGVPRHPIVEDNVIIYAQATILGRITIGANSVIGGNVWVTGDVAPNSRVLQYKARETSFSDGGGI